MEKRRLIKQIVSKDSHFKLIWSGNDKGTDGVGILLAEKWRRMYLRLSESQTGSFSFK